MSQATCQQEGFRQHGRPALTVLWVDAPRTTDEACIAMLKRNGHEVWRLEAASATGHAIRRRPDVVVACASRHQSEADLVTDLRRGSAGAAPLLVLSPADDLESKLGALSAGADDYVTVPYAVAEVLARVNALSRRGRRPRAPTFSAGPLRLSFESRHLSIEGRPVALQPKRFHLLYILMREAPGSVTRQALESELWPSGQGREDQVRGIVWRIRRDLEPLFGARLIESMPRGGYRFCQEVAACI